MKKSIFIGAMLLAGMIFNGNVANAQDLQDEIILSDYCFKEDYEKPNHAYGKGTG